MASNGVPITTDKPNKLECADGTFCTGNPNDWKDDSWKCCNNKGGRVRCPTNHPYLCANKACAGGTAKCCEKDCNAPGFGGNLPCPKSKFDK